MRRGGGGGGKDVKSGDVCGWYGGGAAPNNKDSLNATRGVNKTGGTGEVWGCVGPRGGAAGGGRGELKKERGRCV